jgi:hypothetical protein
MVRLNVLGSAHSQGMSPDCSQHLSFGFPNITPTGFQVEAIASPRVVFAATQERFFFLYNQSLSLSLPVEGLALGVKDLTVFCDHRLTCVRESSALACALENTDSQHFFASATLV